MIRLPLQIAVFSAVLWSALIWCSPAAFADKVQVIRSVEYATYDQRDVKGELTGKQRELLADIYLPVKVNEKSRSADDTLHPTVLMVHGGAWFSGNKAHVTLHARDVAEAGYAVVAVNYRLAPHYKFPAQLDDLRSALRFIETNAKKYRFDTKRIAGYGYSAGAHLVSLLAVTQNEAKENLVKGARIQAVVAGGTPCEFSWVPERSTRLAFWLGDSREKDPDAYDRASPITFVNKGDPPMFFFHGTTDRIVPYASAAKMKRKLDENDVSVEFFAVKDKDHFGAFIDPKSRGEAIRFLCRQLGESK